MQIARRQIMRLAAGATAFPIVSFVAIAEDFPSRPITWVVPFPAGGPVDTVARIMTDPMSRLLQQPIVIENVSDAAGSIGAGRVARAPPDGYMLIHGIWSTHVVNGAVYRLSYERVRRFRTHRALDGCFADYRCQEIYAGRRLASFDRMATGKS